MSEEKPERTIERLNDRQRAFVLHYIGDCGFNATRAAIASGYSETTAYSIASENLKKPEVREAIREELAHASLTPETIKRKLTSMATANIADFEPFINGGKTLCQLKAEGVDTSLIESVEVYADKDGNRRRKVKLYSAKGCMDSLIRVLGMAEDVIRHKGAEGGVINIVLQEAVRPEGED